MVKREGWVALVAIVLAVIGIAAILLRSEPRSAGVNGVAINGAIATIRPGATLCQRGEVVPDGAGVARFYLGTPDGRPARVRVAVGPEQGPPRTHGDALAPGGFVSIPLESVERGLAPARVCLTNAGRGRLDVGGQVADGDPSVTIGDEAQLGRARIDWYRPGDETALGMIPLVAERFGRGKSEWLGTWTLWLLAAMVLAALVLAGVTVRRALGAEQ